MHFSSLVTIHNSLALNIRRNKQEPMVLSDLNQLKFVLPERCDSESFIFNSFKALLVLTTISLTEYSQVSRSIFLDPWYRLQKVQA